MLDDHLVTQKVLHTEAPETVVQGADTQDECNTQQDESHELALAVLIQVNWYEHCKQAVGHAKKVHVSIVCYRHSRHSRNLRRCRLRSTSVGGQVGC